MGAPRLNLTGQRFGRLTVVAFDKVAFDKERTRNGSTTWWKCLCDCGNTKLIRGYTLRRGQSRSCGCLQAELSSARLRTHGMTHTPEHIAWSAMQCRCRPTTKHRKDYKYYVSKGVKVCPQWQGPNGFSNFLAHIGLRPGAEYSLDRYPNNNGNYEPGNVRWATSSEQQYNLRPRIPLDTSRHWSWERYSEELGA